MHIPEYYRKKILTMRGDDGQQWLTALPTLIQSLEKQWKISVEDPVANLSYGYVCHARREVGTECFLKISFPDEESHTSDAALISLSGKHCVTVLEHDPDQCAVLLKKISPGTPLHALKDNQKETMIAAELIRTIPAPIPEGSPFQTITQWMSVFDRIDRSALPFPAEMLNQAKTLGEQLNTTNTEAGARGHAPLLLHGDLHHDNILWDEEKGWLVIDPKGIIADPLYECARFLRNIWPSHKHRNLKELLQERIAILSQELEADPKSIAGYGYVDCIMSACWSVEDGEENWNETIRAAEIFEELVSSFTRQNP